MFPEERQATSPAAQQVLKICSDGEYVAASGAVVSIERELKASEVGTRLYSPERLEHLRGAAVAGVSLSTSIEIRDATTQQAAKRWQNMATSSRSTSPPLATQVHGTHYRGN